MRLYMRQALLLLPVILWLMTWNASAAGKLTETVDLAYQPDPAALTFLQQIDQPVEIVLVYGAWCPDSQREVPRFMRILNLADNPRITLAEYAVDRKKQDAAGKAEEYGIRFVPTFIVIRDGTELGRIVETPERSLEEDLVTILEGKE